MALIHSKLPEVGTTIFTVMSKMAADHGAINLSQGFPDFPVSSELINLIHEAMQKGSNQYAPMAGLPALRKSISGMTSTRYGFTPNPETEITVTAGATEALFAAIMALVHKGDEVIIFDPGYDSYSPAVVMAGGTPIHLNLSFPDFSIDWEKVKGAINQRTKLIIINSPHNPTGSVLSVSDVRTLEQLVQHHDFYVLSDEVYEHIIFDEEEHQSVLRFPGLRLKSVAVSSFGKTFHATGWKVGYLIASETLTQEIRKVHQYVTFSVHHPTQAGLAEYLKHAAHYSDLGAMYQKKRDFFLDAIKSSNFIPIPCKGTYFQLLDYSTLSEDSDMEMSKKLTQQSKVASIPVSVFYKDNTDNKILRFCFAKEQETLQKAAEILCTI